MQTLLNGQTLTDKIQAHQRIQMMNMSIIIGLLLPGLLYLFFLTHHFGWLKPKLVPENRILLIRNDTVLSVGLFNLLNQQYDMILSTISPLSEHALQEEIDSFKPNVIILTEQLSPSTFDRLFDNMHDMPNMKLICVDIESDLVQIYEKKQISIEQLDDFASLVHGSRKHFSPTTSKPHTQYMV